MPNIFRRTWFLKIAILWQRKSECKDFYRVEPYSKVETVNSQEAFYIDF